jgi:hypothetical protein
MMFPQEKTVPCGRENYVTYGPVRVVFELAMSELELDTLTPQTPLRGRVNALGLGPLELRLRNPVVRSMKFPFVPRGVYEDVTQMLRDERARTHALTETVVQMRLAGGVMLPTERRQALAPRTRSHFEKLIDENPHAARPGVRAALLRFVAQQQLKNVDPDKIAYELQNWHRVRPAAADDDDDDVDLDDDDVIQLEGPVDLAEMAVVE